MHHVAAIRPSALVSVKIQTFKSPSDVCKRFKGDIMIFEADTNARLYINSTRIVSSIWTYLSSPPVKNSVLAKLSRWHSLKAIFRNLKIRRNIRIVSSKSLTPSLRNWNHLQHQSCITSQLQHSSSCGSIAPLNRTNGVTIATFALLATSTPLHITQISVDLNTPLQRCTVIRVTCQHHQSSSTFSAVAMIIMAMPLDSNIKSARNSQHLLT